MQTALGAVLVAFVIAQAAFAHKGESSLMKVDTSWNVSLDAQGHVVKLEQASQVKAVLSEPLAHAIRDWQFEPGHIDGVAAPTETTLQVGVTLEPMGRDGYVVRVDSAMTGGSLAKARSPRVPASFLRSASAGISALAVVEARYDANGKVIAAELAPGAPKVDRTVGKVAIDAVRGWTFQPERVGGQGVAAAAYVPICFQAGPEGRATPPCPEWTPPGARAAVGNGGSFALEPAATLKSDVIGRTL